MPFFYSYLSVSEGFMLALRNDWMMTINRTKNSVAVPAINTTEMLGDMR